MEERERRDTKTTEAVLTAEPSLILLCYSYPMLAHSDAIIHSVLSVNVTIKVCVCGGGHTHTRTQYTHTPAQLQQRWAYNCKQAGLNNETHIKYKADWGLVEPAVPQQTLTHLVRGK